MTSWVTNAWNAAGNQSNYRQQILPSSCPTRRLLRTPASSALRSAAAVDVAWHVELGLTSASHMTSWSYDAAHPDNRLWSL